jgi:hypothetical protein
MDINETALRLAEQGYTATESMLFDPGGNLCNSFIRISGEYVLSESLARPIWQMQQSRARRSDGKRDLRATVWYTAPHRFR